MPSLSLALGAAALLGAPRPPAHVRPAPDTLPSAVPAPRPPAPDSAQVAAACPLAAADAGAPRRGLAPDRMPSVVPDTAGFRMPRLRSDLGPYRMPVSGRAAPCPPARPR